MLEFGSRRYEDPTVLMFAFAIPLLVAGDHGALLNLSEPQVSCNWKVRGSGASAGVHTQQLLIED